MANTTGGHDVTSSGVVKRTAAPWTPTQFITAEDLEKWPDWPASGETDRPQTKTSAASGWGNTQMAFAGFESKVLNKTAKCSLVFSILFQSNI